MEQGYPAITPKLKEFIENEFARYGNTDSQGRRRIAIGQTMRAIAAQLEVSEGTIKNAMSCLKREGYILSNERMYLCLAPLDAETIKHDDEELIYRDIPAEERRMECDEVTAILRDTIMTCGRDTANAYIDSHRRWCWANNLTPHI